MGLVNPLNDVFFWDAQTGWAVGERGTILHTNDEGATWQRQTSPVDADLRRAEFVGAQTGWIAGVPHRIGGPGKNVLLRTEHGGNAWTECPLPVDGSSFDIDFTWVDAHTGWLIIETWVLHTTDGGQTRQKQALLSRDLCHYQDGRRLIEGLVIRQPRADCGTIAEPR